MKIQDSSNQYQRALGRSTLLTAAREKELSIIIRAEGSPEKDRLAAIDEMVNANLKLVNSLAHFYARKTGSEMEELVSAGHEGIMKAVMRFNAEKGYRFSTYATWWIRQAIYRKLNKSYAVKIPAGVVGAMLKQKRLVAERGELSDDDLMIEMNIDEKALARIKKAKISCLSLDETVGGDNGNSAKDSQKERSATFADENAISPDVQMDQDERRAMLHAAVESLSEIKRDIIRSMELDDTDILKSVGKRWDISGERVRQLKNDALRELRLKLKDLK